MTKNVRFELGAIAWHCREVYRENPGYYNDYIPTNMMSATNDFYNFVADSYPVFEKDNETTLKAAWEMYKTYCEDAKVPYPMQRRIFKEELKNYFTEYTSGSSNRYHGFKKEKFASEENRKESNHAEKMVDKTSWLSFSDGESLLDKIFAECPAQYADSEGKPCRKWENVKTTLHDLDTRKLHFVLSPKNYIFIDFDFTDENGEKSYERNLEEASKWPPTYAELSKSGKAIHLVYNYTGDVSKLSGVYSDKIEIKVANGNSSMRRKLTKCCNRDIATISSGLPLKGEKMVDESQVLNEKGLRTCILRNLKKEYHGYTTPSVQFIKKVLDDAYTSGQHYDVTDLRNAVLQFAMMSHNHPSENVKMVGEMKFKSEEPSENQENRDTDLVFFDIEVFPNLFLVNWKKAGDSKVIRMINPSPNDISDLLKFKLIGFNNRRYDNHILYGRLVGYDNEQLYELSQNIIGNGRGFFGEAYNLSYTDIYDFAAAGNKKSLKKLEIEMGIHHQELGLPWDQPVPEEDWVKVAEYCDNDVIATEAAFNYLKGDWTARLILADLAGMTVNDSTNSLTARIIFGKEKKPQSKFNYRFMGNEKEIARYLDDASDDYSAFDIDDRPIFPGYQYENGKSTYRGEDVGEGGYVYAENGMYKNVALLDIASMHPSSVVAENLFGPYTERFNDILNARIAIKHKDWDTAKSMLGGKLAPYVQKVIDGEMKSKELANALKTAINAVYGQTYAKYENPFKDPRNVDNVVAKRGALFMVNLKHEVQNRGFKVAHIKTDSIKIPNATPEIIEFVMWYGKQYGYNFEHEATYDRMCLVNKATYIAKYASEETCQKLYGYIPGDNKDHPGEWTATAEQFQQPYVFKMLFSHEKISFDDMCEVKSATKGALYLDFNEGLPDDAPYWKELADIDKREKRGEQDDWECGRGVCYENIEKCHNYRFVGRVGQFTPVKSGCDGGLLMRKQDNKYYAATGTTGYRWKESEVLRQLNTDEVDESYYKKLCDDAVHDISQYGDFNKFVSDDFSEDDIYPF